MNLYSEANKYFEEILKEENVKLNESLKKKRLREGFRSSPYYRAIKRVMNGDTEAADIVYDWYSSEEAFDDFDNAKQFEEYIKTDIYDMLGASGDKKETRIVYRALGEVEDAYAVFTQREGEESTVLYTTSRSEKEAILEAKEQLGTIVHPGGPDEVNIKAYVVASDDEMDVYYSSLAKFLSSNNVIYEADLMKDGSIKEKYFN